MKTKTAQLHIEQVWGTANSVWVAIRYRGKAVAGFDGQPVDEALEQCRLCLRNATKAGDELACAHFKTLIWAFETEQSTGIFPKAELDARINTLNN